MDIETKAKHTPGPWTARPFASPVGSWYITDSKNDLLLGAGRTIFEAEGRLIAAAPELLEVAQMTVQAMMMETGKSVAPDFGPTDLLKKAEAAIAKAEGR